MIVGALSMSGGGRLRIDERTLERTSGAQAPFGARFDSVEQARLAVFSWIAFYNQRRRHSALSYRSPVDYERLIASPQPQAA